MIGPFFNPDSPDRPTWPEGYGPPEVYPFLGGPRDYMSASYNVPGVSIPGGVSANPSSVSVYPDGTPLGFYNGTDIGAAPDHPVSIARYYSGYWPNAQATLNGVPVYPWSRVR